MTTDTDEALRRLLDAGLARAAAIDPEHARLWEPLRRHRGRQAVPAGARARAYERSAAPTRPRSRSGPPSSCCTRRSSSTTTSSTATTCGAAAPTSPAVPRPRRRAPGASPARRDGLGRRRRRPRRRPRPGRRGADARWRPAAPRPTRAPLLDLLDDALPSLPPVSSPTSCCARAGDATSLAESSRWRSPRPRSTPSPAAPGGRRAGRRATTPRGPPRGGRPALGIGFQLVDDLRGVFGDGRDRQERPQRPARGQAHHPDRARAGRRRGSGSGRYVGPGPRRDGGRASGGCSWSRGRGLRRGARRGPPSAARSSRGARASPADLLAP